MDIHIYIYGYMRYVCVLRGGIKSGIRGELEERLGEGKEMKEVKG